ncbi:response regulator transcription factor [Spirosoma utsteinense]|uniref:DNA-binding NarL/FixJ family response regulator n=1 Tax=Spirosoma utsteinense TaxID=2585773 RepID=A0ABR6W030_9BACT|nr:response regulator transcription factor [Spirosoma utsteinense]MBC3784717.1 DNA-binding NarL/FixJ family response regulator [Spirosoma utsteinense]MBC3789529.1 DNA-binding NarL/FixJ family response regulator [Spirosoma utsteinense]
MSIRLLIADDHAVVRKGIRTLLEDETDIDVVGEATDGDYAIDMIPEVKPDVLLLDITMPRMSGIDVTKVVSKQYPNVRILIFSMHHNPDYILKAVQHGAAGYLLKDTNEEEILRAVRSVATGEFYYPPSASSIIIKQFMADSAYQTSEPDPEPERVRPGSVWQKITAREAQILTCLTQGMSNRQIAERFTISPNTVANQRASIIRKAGVTSSFELVQLALKDEK